MVATIIKRKISAFEILLLLTGVAIIIGGTITFNALVNEALNFHELVMYIIMWLVLFFLIVICAISENAREELGVIIQENSKEIKLLREISKEHLDEIKLLRSASKTKKK